MIDLEKAALIVRRREISQGLEKYKYFRERLFETDVTKDEVYQKEYRAFYQMRRFYNNHFAEGFFSLMEKAKEKKGIDFQYVFTNMQEIQGTCEISFSSKLLHTIDPSYPIWDSIVTRNHFGINPPYSSCKKKSEACIAKYNGYKQEFYQYLNSEEGISLIEIFDQQYPNSGIHDVKKADFILWQDR